MNVTSMTYTKILQECDMKNVYLAHHGIQGQKWGVRRFQNEDGTLTPEGRKRYGLESMDSTAKSDLTGRAARRAARKERNKLQLTVNEKANAAREEAEMESVARGFNAAITYANSMGMNPNGMVFSRDQNFLDAANADIDNQANQAYKEIDDYINKKYGEQTVRDLNRQDLVTGVGILAGMGAAMALYIGAVTR